jgi:hypothetical protein
MNAIDGKRVSVLYFITMVPKLCRAVYYGGLPVKGARRKGRLWVEEETICFKVPQGKGADKIDLKIPFSKIEKISLTRDNYYGADTVIFNLTFLDQNAKSYTARFAPIAIIPRRRIALQKQWWDYLANAINSEDRSSLLSTR